MADSPTVIILAGVNGAGKTTAARTLLAEALRVLTFVNADVIAQGLAGFDPDSAALKAGKVMLEQLRELAARRENFAFETTLSGRSYAAWLEQLRAAGYRAHLVYFWLESAELAVARVAERVKMGGHRVPEGTIRTRYGKSIRNFFRLYMPLADSWRVYDNSGDAGPRLVAHGGAGEAETVTDRSAWARMKSG